MGTFSVWKKSVNSMSCLLKKTGDGVTRRDLVEMTASGNSKIVSLQNVITDDERGFAVPFLMHSLAMKCVVDEVMNHVLNHRVPMS